MKNKIIDSLIEIGAVKFGTFTLKSGIESPIYIDLRIIVSYPQLLSDIADAFAEMMKDLKFDQIAGIPYTALPIATAISIRSNVPMIYARKEKKKYGTGQQIEGIWKKGDKVLLIDDLITTGLSKEETFVVFNEAGLEVSDIAVLIDREQGGQELLKKTGHNLHSMISVFDILERLKEQNKIEDEMYNKVKSFLLNQR